MTINISTATIKSIDNSSIEFMSDHLNLLKLKKENKKKLLAFLEPLGFIESGNNWKRYNKYGYMGQWQFGKAALKDVGYSHVKYKDFKKNPQIFPPEDQLDAMIKYMKINEKILHKIIKKYEGKVINGIKITKSGILAAAHLGGAGSVQEFFKTNGNKDFSDANGTKISKYLKNYGGYNFDLQLV